MIWLLVIPAVAQILVVVWVAIRTTPSVENSDPQARTTGLVADRGPHPRAVCLVAARNEESNLDRCLEALSNQTHPVPVVVIDDHSEDGTRQVVESWMQRFEGRLSLASGGPGKAMALAAGMKTAVAMTSEVVLTTDADCAPAPDWAAGMLRRFGGSDGGGGDLEESGSPGVLGVPGVPGVPGVLGVLGVLGVPGALGVLGGCTMIRTRGFLSRLEALDWAILLATASASSSAGFPLTAMGNNMAIRRAALERVGGFEAVADTPTEDYALFRGISQFAPVRLELARDLLNWTEPAGSLRAIVRQRRRWAAGGMRSGAAAELQGVAIMVLGLVALAGPYVLLTAMPIIGASLLLARWLAHAVLARRVSRVLNIPLAIAWVPVHDLLMTIYTVVVPVSLLFSRSISWKGRSAA